MVEILLKEMVIDVTLHDSIMVMVPYDGHDACYHMPLAWHPEN